MSTATARAGSPARASRVPAPLRGPAATAVVLAAGSVLAVLAGLLLVTRADGWGTDAAAQVPVDAAIAVAYPLAGVVVLLGRRARVLGWLLVGVGVASAAAVLASSVVAAATSAGPGVQAAAWLQGWVWVPGFAPLLAVLPLLYPDGRLPSPRWRLPLLAGLVGTGLVTVAVALFPEDVVGGVVVSKPLTAEAVARVLVVPGGVLLGVALLSGLAALVVRLRRSGGLERRQVLVAAVAAAVLVVEAVLHGSLPAGVQVVAQPLAVALLPVALGVAVTRHDLFELDVAVLRALVGLSTAVCLAGAFVTVFAVLRALVPADTAVATAAAAGLTGLAVQPLARRLGAATDRLYYGDRTDPWRALDGLATRLRGDLAVDEVPLAVCEAVTAALRLPAAELVLTSGRTAARVGEVEGAVHEVPLAHRAEPVASLRVALRRGERSLDPRDRALLDALAAAAAPAVASLGLYEALRSSREALVASREEERRRLRRDLHDGVGAALAGARLQLESARDRVDEPLTAGMLDAAGRAVAEAVADVRRLTDDLRPPSLDELGLAGSLTALAARTSTPDRRVDVHVEPLPELPAAVEVALHRIASEALTNAARHSGARRVALRLQHAPRELVLEVVDDGRGVPAERRSGVGLESMRQRAEELGGRLDVDTAGGGGTRVRAVLPREALVPAQRPPSAAVQVAP